MSQAILAGIINPSGETGRIDAALPKRPGRCKFPAYRHLAEEERVREKDKHLVALMHTFLRYD